MDAIIQALIDLAVAVIIAATPLIVGGVIVAIRSKFNEFVLSQPENVREAYQYAAKLGIRLAETVYNDLEPKEKLNKALDAGKEWLIGMGYKSPDDSMLRTSIEALLDAVKNEIFLEKAEKQKLG